MKLYWIIGITFYICSQSAYGQNNENVKTAELLSDFKESFDKRAKVSGTPLAGMKLIGPAVRRAETAKFILLPKGQDTDVCIETNTRDGRYNSLNQYRIRDRNFGLVPAKIEPTTVKYASELSLYNDDDFAVLTSLRVDQNCGLKEAVFFPRVNGPLWVRKVIFDVNSRSRLASIVTQDNKGQVIQGDCDAIDAGANIAFDKRCLLDVTEIDLEIFKISLKLDDGFGEEVHEFSVYIPRKTQ